MPWGVPDESRRRSRVRFCPKFAKLRESEFGTELKKIAD
jgi:hypothetical protein